MPGMRKNSKGGQPGIVWTSISLRPSARRRQASAGRPGQTRAEAVNSGKATGRTEKMSAGLGGSRRNPQGREE